MKRTKENTLVVDDVRTMKFEATTVRRLETAFIAVYAQPWNEVWLDHDLELALESRDEFFMREYNIRPLIRKIEEDAHNGILLPINKFVVHSANGAGAGWMMAALSPHYKVVRAMPWDWVAHEALPDWFRLAFEVDGEDA